MREGKFIFSREKCPALEEIPKQNDLKRAKLTDADDDDRHGEVGGRDDGVACLVEIRYYSVSQNQKNEVILQQTHHYTLLHAIKLRLP